MRNGNSVGFAWPATCSAHEFNTLSTSERNSRGYYFAFAAIGWFFSPIVFMAATLGVVTILYQREFRSEVLSVLNS